MPRVSVIVPNYNHARFLDRRLRSVLEQTFQDFELLLLDDASTDGSLSIIEGYLHDPRVSLHRNRHNSGSPFPQWNKGVHLATADLVWIAEADDDADPRLLQSLVSVFDQHADLVLAYAQSETIDEEDRPLGCMTTWTANLDARRWEADFTADGRAECESYLFVKNTVPNASAVLFKRAAFLHAGGAPEDMRLCGDWLTWARVLQQGRLAFIAAPLNRFRQHRSTQRATLSRQTFFAEALTVVTDIAQHCSPTTEAYARAGTQTRQNAWLALHHSPPPFTAAWLWQQAWRSAIISRALPLQILALGVLASLLRTRLGLTLLHWKRIAQPA